MGAPFVTGTAFVAGKARAAGTAFVIGATLVTAGAFDAGVAFVIGTAFVEASSARLGKGTNPSSPSAKRRTRRFMATTFDDAANAKDQAGTRCDPVQLEADSISDGHTPPLH
jgi:hypothetical protein